jgi:hypothetical protein
MTAQCPALSIGLGVALALVAIAGGIAAFLLVLVVLAEVLA